MTRLFYGKNKKCIILKLNNNGSKKQKAKNP